MSQLPDQLLKSANIPMMMPMNPTRFTPANPKSTKYPSKSKYGYGSRSSRPKISTKSRYK